MGTGTLKFQLFGKQVVAYVSNAAGLTNMRNLASHLSQYTHAAIPYVSYTVSDDPEIPENSPPATADVGLFANVMFRRTSDDKLYGLLISAPVLTMFETVVNRGYRVKPSIGEQLAQIYSTCAGETFTFHEGWLQGSSLRGTSAP